MILILKIIIINKVNNINLMKRNIHLIKNFMINLEKFLDRIFNMIKLYIMNGLKIMKNFVLKLLKIE